MGSELEHLGQDLQRSRVALVAHHSSVLVLDLAAPLADLVQQHRDRLEDVERLEPGGHERLAVLLRHEPVRPVADHRGHVAGTEKAVETQVRRFEDGLDRRNDRHVVGEDVEVPHVLLACLQQRDRSRGRRRLEADGEEDDVSVGVLDCEAQRVER